MFQNAKEYDDVFDCIMVTRAKKNDDLICNPIYHFTEADIWQYIEEKSIEINPLYRMGYRRVGCVMCPLGGRKSMLQEAADFPKYKNAYIRAFDRMLKARQESGKDCRTWENGQDVFDWWIGDFDGQTRLEI